MNRSGGESKKPLLSRAGGSFVDSLTRSGSWLAGRRRRLWALTGALALLFAALVLLPKTDPCSSGSLAKLRRQLGLTPLEGCRETGTTGAVAAAGEAGSCPNGFVRIEPGTFTMGSPETEGGRDRFETQHPVTITRAYCMKATEVTQGEWEALMGSNPAGFPTCGANCPVEQVSWEDAVRYANALSRREGLPECYIGSIFTGLACAGYRLPTEAEWEYAARAGTTTATYAGNLTIRGAMNAPELNPIAWYGGNSGTNYGDSYDCSDFLERQYPSERCGPHPIRQKQPKWGLYDMLGNVWEWTGDWYGAYSDGETDPTGPPVGSHRVLRGGSWAREARFARAAFRGVFTVDARSYDVGFRLARTAPIAAESVDTVGAAPAFGASTDDTVVCPQGYVRIAPGTFTMGSPVGEADRDDDDDDERQHSVTITRAFCMKATEVTQSEWQTVMGSNPSRFSNCGANCPVERVSWEDAVGYANALSRRGGLPECYAGSTFTGLGCRGYRLPTEAEWEYAARAGTAGATYGNLDSVAWYPANSGSATHPVGQKQPNAWGLYDMLGNVWEWTGDWFGAYSGETSDPAGAPAGPDRVWRGGSWFNINRETRVALRGIATPDVHNGHLGFRLVRTAPSRSKSVDAVSGAAAVCSSAGITGVCPKGYVSIAPGAFIMGSPETESGREANETQRSVTITRGYCMKATEVTQAEWYSVMGYDPSLHKDCGPDCPVEKVDWNQIITYTNELSRREGLTECYEGSAFAGLACTGYRLPTEAEWEYSARAGTVGSAYGDLNAVAWYEANSEKMLHRVGTKQPNAWGLYDMLGNVWEWTGYGQDLSITDSSSAIDPIGDPGGFARGTRGGSTFDIPRAARRSYSWTSMSASLLGFRLVRTVTRSCDALPLNATAGVEARGADGWRECEPTNCVATFHPERGACVKDTRACVPLPANTRAGTQSWNSGTIEYDSCNATACSASYHVESGVCLSDTRSCAIANGKGREKYASGKWGKCKLTDCEPAYHAERGACLSDTEGCDIANGTGTKTHAAGAWGECRVLDCNAGYHLESGACLSDTRTCSTLPANATAGTQTWTGSDYGTCSATACVSGYEVNMRACSLGLSVGTACTLNAECASGYCATGPTGTANGRCAPTGMNYIPAGTFTMGSPGGELGQDTDETQHSVTLSRAFFMGQTEVTQGQWKALSGGTTNPSNFSTCGDNCPVETMDWYAAVAFANARSAAEGLTSCYTLTGCADATNGWKDGIHTSCTAATFTGLNCTGYRLPTESEWEYAARAGTTTATYGGNLSATTDCVTLNGTGGFAAGTALGSLAWYDCNAASRTQAVGGKSANSFGLYDMLGNVWEWTGDWYNTYPATVTDPTGPITGSTRVVRGGSWYGNARDARAASRNAGTPGLRYDNLGFRLSRTAP